jgi:hypothetical protein
MASSDSAACHINSASVLTEHKEKPRCFKALARSPQKTAANLLWVLPQALTLFWASSTSFIAASTLRPELKASRDRRVPQTPHLCRRRQGYRQGQTSLHAFRSSQSRGAGCWRTANRSAHRCLTNNDNTLRGPQLRSPTGGNLVKAAKALASATVLIMGAIMPAAPMSSILDAVAKSPTGMRMMAGFPARPTWAIPRIAFATSNAPCCMSSTAASNHHGPVAPRSLAQKTPTQAQKTHSPARIAPARPATACRESMSNYLWARWPIAIPQPQGLT